MEGKGKDSSMGVKSSLTLPYSKAEIRFTEDFSPKRLQEVARKAIDDEHFAKQLRTDPTTVLKSYGVEVDEADRKKITTDDLLVSLGQRPFPDNLPGPYVPTGPSFWLLILALTQPAE